MPRNGSPLCDDKLPQSDLARGNALSLSLSLSLFRSLPIPFSRYFSSLSALPLLHLPVFLPKGPLRCCEVRQGKRARASAHEREREWERGKKKRSFVHQISTMPLGTERDNLVRTNCYYKYHITPNWYQLDPSFFGFAVQDLRSHWKDVCVCVCVCVGFLGGWRKLVPYGTKLFP